MNPSDEDNIRAPDSIIQDQLLNHDRDEFDKQLDEAMYISLQDLKQQRDEQAQYESTVVKQYEDETDHRRTLFKEFMFQLSRLSKYDANIQEVMEIISPIVDAYCYQFIETCELDSKTHEKIFSTISRIRKSDDVISLLSEIIIKTYE